MERMSFIMYSFWLKDTSSKGRPMQHIQHGSTLSNVHSSIGRCAGVHLTKRSDMSLKVASQKIETRATNVISVIPADTLCSR